MAIKSCSIKARPLTTFFGAVSRTTDAMAVCLRPCGDRKLSGAYHHCEGLVGDECRLFTIPHLSNQLGFFDKSRNVFPRPWQQFRGAFRPSMGRGSYPHFLICAGMTAYNPDPSIQEKVSSTNDNQNPNCRRPRCSARRPQGDARKGRHSNRGGSVGRGGRI